MGIIESRKAATDSYRLLQNLITRVHAANTFHDKDLTPEGLQNARTERLNKSRTVAAAKAQKLIQTAQDGVEFTDSKIDKFRPQVDPENVAQLTRSAQAWEMTVKPLRDQGKSWFEIMEVLDVDGLMAMDRFAEQTIRLTEAKQDAEIILHNLRDATDRRLAEVHPSEEARTAFAEATEAKELSGIVQSIAGSVESVRNQSTGAVATINATRRLHPTGLTPSGPPPTVETLDWHVTNTPYDATVIP